MNAEMLLIGQGVACVGQGVVSERWWWVVFWENGTSVGGALGVACLWGWGLRWGGGVLAGPRDEQGASHTQLGDQRYF